MSVPVLGLSVMQSSRRRCFRANSLCRIPPSCCRSLPRFRSHLPSREKRTGGRNCGPTVTIVEVLQLRGQTQCEQGGNERLDLVCQGCKLCIARGLSGKRSASMELVCHTSDISWHCDATGWQQVSPFVFDDGTLRRSSWGSIREQILQGKKQ